ncbi:MAG: PAS domain-containing protein [Candidatus Marinimicrobia bacterium]|nr:PAS domain-containing protein [Candidatus Neomarinimicrobiota bacterium]MCF7829589.1 PAS domain-containing protein [Candidatus Neomarinimicrobiota bacterium]MCF7882243.1 PAS domain-containing protein [Candidatus Neomarinimicrobiota bacterium]
MNYPKSVGFRDCAVDFEQQQSLKLEQKGTKPVLILKSSGHIYYGNSMFSSLLGYNTQTIYTEHVFEILYPDDIQTFVDGFLRLLKNPAVTKTNTALRIYSSEGLVWTKVVMKILKSQSEEIGIKITILDQSPVPIR